MPDYTDDPDERITVVSYDGGHDAMEPHPLFAVETQTDGVEAANLLVERHGGRSRWTTVPFHRVGSYDYDVSELIPEGDDGDH